MTKMDMIYNIFFYGPLIFGCITGAIVALVGCCVIKPDKVVRIMFPYIKKNGNNTVAFGFILTKWHIGGLFGAVCLVIGGVIWTVCANIFITYTNNNNLLSATSTELQCFHDNGTKAELILTEREKLDEDIHVLCYAINFNIPGAMGQVTGALTFGWVMASILTWIELNVNYTIIQCIKNSKKNLKCCKWFLTIIEFMITLIVTVLLCIIAALYNNKQWSSYLFFKPESITIFLILASVIFAYSNNIKKEPKSLEECCSETMKERQKAEMSRRRGYERTQLKRKNRLILREMAEQECKRQLAYETAIGIDDEETMDIVQTAYDNIMEHYEDREEELRTINGSIEETSFGPESDHNPLPTIQNTQEIPL